MKMERQRVLIVGGFVRDHLLGRHPTDLDFVVVGMTEEQFLEQYPQAKKGGRFFPVFKFKGEDYAFARKERSNGYGHNDFDTHHDVDVTLEEDLSRRDLTINALAMCPETGEIIGVENALEDLENGVVAINDPVSQSTFTILRY